MSDGLDRSSAGETAPVVGMAIVTALPEEGAAMRMLLHDPQDQTVPGDPNNYRSGWLPSKDPDRPHRVAIATQVRDGTRNAAAVCTDMARSFPQVREFVMCGISGGIPDSGAARGGLLLGDIVVATGGIVDYDHVRTVDGTDTLRRSVSGLSAMMLRADHELEMRGLAGDEPWREALAEQEALFTEFRRPPRPMDPMYAAAKTDERPRSRRPFVHRGAIGSADRLLRDAARRDALAAEYGVKAIEMEGSGIATAAELHDRNWFMVRGVADYCDNRTKNDEWHRYAALAAATYTCALLAECKPQTAADHTTVTAERRLQSIVDALLALPPMRDDYQRRAILAQLPDHIRTAIPDSVTARLHIVAVVYTCEQYPDGRNALIDTLRLTIGHDSPHFRSVEAVISRNWRDRR